MGGRRAKLGVVGLGMIGSWHAELLADGVPGAELGAVTEPREDVGRAVADRLGVPLRPYGELLQDPDIDGVVLATPVPMHAAMIEEAAAAGKHIFCEKPLAFDLDETADTVTIAERHNVWLQVGFMRRFDPDWRHARDLIRGGSIGEVFLYRATQRFWADYPDHSYIDEVGNLFRDMMVHEFDLARWLVGEVEEVNAWGVNPTKPELSGIGDTQAAIVELRFASGAIGAIDGTMLCDYGFDCFGEVVGVDGALRIGQHARTTDVESIVNGVSRLSHSTRDPRPRFRKAFVAELAHFAESILERRPPAVGGRDSLAASALAEAATKSLLSGQPVNVPPLPGIKETA